MVDVTRHLAMALLFAAPAWFIWGRRGAIGFTALALTTAMLPDTDLFLRAVLPITHHGLTHTLLFVAVLSVLAGWIAARWLTDWLNAHRWVKSTAISEKTVFVFATAGLFTGGVSHIFADVLSAPDVAAPLAPFWPFYRQPFVIDLLYYDSVWWNFGLLAVALAVHGVLGWHDRYPVDTRYRIGDRDDS